MKFVTSCNSYRLITILRYKRKLSSFSPSDFSNWKYLVGCFRVSFFTDNSHCSLHEAYGREGRG